MLRHTIFVVCDKFNGDKNMKEWVVLFSVRILVCGFAVFCALGLFENGKYSEILRFSCACFMTAVILTSFKSGSMALTDVSEYIEETKNIIEQSVSMAERDSAEDTAKLLEQEINDSLAQHGMKCQASVEYSIDEDGKCNISKIRVSGAQGSREEIKTLLMILTGMDEEGILFEDISNEKG